MLGLVLKPNRHPLPFILNEVNSGPPAGMTFMLPLAIWPSMSWSGTLSPSARQLRCIQDDKPNLEIRLGTISARREPLLHSDQPDQQLQRTLGIRHLASSGHEGIDPLPGQSEQSTEVGLIAVLLEVRA